METKSKKIIIVSIVIALALALIIISSLMLLVGRDKEFDISKSSATLTQTPDYGENYINGLIFLADSSISGIIDAGVLSDGADTYQVWTGKGGSVMLDSNIDKTTVILPETGEEILISQALERKKPRYLLITLGFENAVPYCERDAFCKYYDKLISAVEESSPDTKIILQSILPVTSGFEFKHKEYSNEKIDNCNIWICELAEKHGVRFLNTAEALKNSSGRLIGDYANKDGSLNAAGYGKMLEYIRTHGYKEASEDGTQAASASAEE